MNTIDLDSLDMLVMYSLLLIPFMVFYIYRIKLIKKTVISVLRMSMQLGLVGFYLGFIFELNNVWLNFLWVLGMIVVANVSVVRSCGLKLRYFLVPTFLGVCLSSLFVVFVFVFLVIRSAPIYDARYLIPIMGMLLVNCLRANIISLERFYFSIRDGEKEFLTYLFMGASLPEAIRPYMLQSLKAAILPTISTMATLGLVSLPGMMTGQILGGSIPLVAIKYQIAIMISIFTTIVLATVLNIQMSLKFAFNDYSLLKMDIFSNTKSK